MITRFVFVNEALSRVFVDAGPEENCRAMESVFLFGYPRFKSEKDKSGEQLENRTIKHIN